MKEFECSSEAMVLGPVLQAFLAAFGPYKERGERVLKRHLGVEEVNTAPSSVYSLKQFLAAMQEIQEQFGKGFMEKIAMNIYDSVLLPPDWDYLETALPELSKAYHMNHTEESWPHIGNYHYRKESDSRVIMFCDHPYPCAFIYGVLRSFCKRLPNKKGTEVKVTHDESKECRGQGGESCTYIIEW